MDGARGAVTGDGGSECKFHSSEIRDIPVRLEFGFERVVFGVGGRNADYVVDVYSEDRDARIPLSLVDTPFVCKMFKADGDHGFVEGLIPNPAGLLHAVEAFRQAPYPVRFFRFFKTRWLLHENSFHFGENPVKESCLDVEMLYVPIETCGDMHQGAKRLETSGRSGRLLIVNEVALSKTFSNITNFVTGDVARIIPFLFADKLPF